jgi:hypothetical protein
VRELFVSFPDAKIDSWLGRGAGHEAVDFVVGTLPSMIKSSLASAVEAYALTPVRNPRLGRF